MERMHLSVVKLFYVLSFFSFSCSEKPAIDRYLIVTRHNVEIDSPDSLNPLSVGNGKFAFTVDITGLQSFPEYYLKGIPLGTMSEWGWHSAPNIKNYKLSDVYKTYNIHGREVDYVHRFTDLKDSIKTGASEYFRRNPHRIHLGIVGLEFPNRNDSYLGMELIKDPMQILDLWKGEIHSSFKFEGSPVEVLTVCHPNLDIISARIVSPLTGEGKVRVKIHFPDGPDVPSGFGFNNPNHDSITVIEKDETGIILKRVIDSDTYYILISNGLKSTLLAEGDSWFIQAQQADSVIEFSCLFSKDKPDIHQFFYKDSRDASILSWEKFWNSGGAVDFSECTDNRAFELERRVVLSQYLTRIQCAGSLPPAETGLTYNSWYGKFHLEMHWWHAAHYALWQRPELLEKQLGYYNRIFEKARATASHQGYKGIRWPKMTDPSGNESPSGVGTYLIWQQPHLIYFAELLYQNSEKKSEILDKYKDLVFATADFMASYAWYDSTKKKYALGPVLISAQESLGLETTVNPTFELVYWYWGLKTALNWKRRLTEIEDEKWKNVIENMSPLPIQNGVYLSSEDTEDTWTNQRYISDHPIISGVLGMIPETGLVDKNVLSNSLDTIQKKWNWDSCWGWDFPMLAMSAAAIGRSEQAVDFLMMDAPKNRYLVNGHNYQDTRLSIYLPGNGGILSAVAMMCTSKRFPKNGKWKVRWENLGSI